MVDKLVLQFYTCPENMSKKYSKIWITKLAYESFPWDIIITIRNDYEYEYAYKPKSGED